MFKRKQSYLERKTRERKIIQNFGSLQRYNKIDKWMRQDEIKDKIYGAVIVAGSALIIPAICAIGGGTLDYYFDIAKNLSPIKSALTGGLLGIPLDIGAALMLAIEGASDCGY
ncbi:hypothetical protein BMS3Abin17_00188 [archaeon BMS3Abin17]|nr:hypothetical protein BMS3Abin17_00188 [archaeon BMS3Abin17]HDZ61298.1 hypothetical protein [Candidatus Pacearchaeota archaeon]